ncbi:MAG: hypothetical protein IKD93_08170 [Firmicutes bacterium]|nr:hypothetical protein [Bacillota bacterium]
MMMIVKLCIVLGLMGVVAVALNRLFPARPGQDEPRSLNDLIHEMDGAEEADAGDDGDDEAEDDGCPPSAKD